MSAGLLCPVAPAKSLAGARRNCRPPTLFITIITTTHKSLYGARRSHRLQATHHIYYYTHQPQASSERGVVLLCNRGECRHLAPSTVLVVDPAILFRTLAPVISFAEACRTARRNRPDEVRVEPHILDRKSREDQPQDLGNGIHYYYYCQSLFGSRRRVIWLHQW